MVNTSYIGVNIFLSLPSSSSFSFFLFLSESSHLSQIKLCRKIQINKPNNYWMLHSFKDDQAEVQGSRFGVSAKRGATISPIEKRRIGGGGASAVEMVPARCTVEMVMV
ncbi:uncharacterized protein LOC107014963 isoform X2 [Solanum pennellii]|uniref:Uncharacterized protein LOC107014963 isoform X2 n=1 Tax=Solanum pennellii TaxID=28526 RepID=A0ABM1V5X7_SOLPN|nr:uncharacterized protein LOC107014963 isoform X2 [Solanum pennellii]